MSTILFSETHNQTLLRIIGAQKAVNIATDTLPDESTVNTLSRKREQGIEVTILVQSNLFDDSAVSTPFLGQVFVRLLRFIIVQS